MSESIFDDKSVQPDNDRLLAALGESAVYWEDIKNHLREKYGELTEDWKYYSQKSGWILKTLKKKRNLFFFIPVENSFKITFVFGDKAVAAIERSDLPAEIIATLKNAKKYAEGRGIQLEVTSPARVEEVKKLVAVKLST